MTDETRNERPRLPPGWEWRELVGDAYPFGPGCDWVRADPEDLPGSADRCWARWVRVSGITREKWEQVERDHEAMGALREHIPEGGRCRMSFHSYYPNGDGCKYTGFCAADDPAETCQGLADRLKKSETP